MVSQKLDKFLLYRLRFVLAYLLFSVALATLLIVAGFYLPGGLTDGEIESALISDNLNPTRLFSLLPEELLYLPYRLLQAASIAVFDFSSISIKLPSIILGIASALGILYLLNLWYRRNVAIVGAIVAVTTNQFLLTSQAGHAGITYIFLTTYILIAASMIARRSAYARIWVIVGFILAAISLYMPLNLYMLLALLITAFIHPHARHLLLRKSSKPIVLLGSVIFLALISPLVLGLVHDISLVPTLLGIPTDWSAIWPNLQELFNQYARFYEPRSGAVLVPIYGLGIVLLILLGLYRLVTTKYTTKSYIISFWLVLLIPLVILNPSFISITFVPVVLLLALGIDYLIWSWYRLFPRNPYARVFGLLPLAVLIAGLAISNVDRYVYGFHYDKEVYAAYNFDLGVLTNELKNIDKNETVYLVVSPENAAFYANFSKHQNYVSSLQVVSTSKGLSPESTLIVERSLHSQVNRIPSKIIVSRASHDADRFYLYKKATN
ncbi:MAG TPA: glycosyltransferase family 39 protein [Candidatus Saccharibacteria bacterium]|nr:glycosyltransferase family 39 protein [Candidatus Saccharibacteria bacterium]HRK94236.1 glycosyltransferase family 39 protein [Candidatus Saccharibacteria bacterium]